MPRQAVIFEVVIASPSDVPEERAIVQNVINNWNTSNSLTSGILLDPIMWETHVHPDMSDRPQGVINDQVLSYADAVIGIFWSRIGTHSGAYESGSVEEIEHFVRRKKQTLVYFSRRPVSVDIDIAQLQKVREYEVECSKRGIIGTYTTLEEFEDKVRCHIERLTARFRHQAEVKQQMGGAGKRQRKASLYVVETDVERLKVQADNLLQLDMAAIDKAVQHVRGQDREREIRILDVGCANGYVTRTRFSSLGNAIVTGIDVSEKAIATANEEAFFEGVEYLVQDVNRMCSSKYCFDIVFCALTLHHLENPEGTMGRLWAMLREPGVFLVRGSDDGLKVNYPDDDELDFLVQCTNTIRGSSDRHNGRKIFSHMQRLSPKPLKTDMDFKLDSTAGMTLAERLAFYDDNYSFRANYAIRVANAESATEADIFLAERLERIVREQRKRFEREDDIFSVTIQNIGIAYKGVGHQPPARG